MLYNDKETYRNSIWWHIDYHHEDDWWGRSIFPWWLFRGWSQGQCLGRDCEANHMPSSCVWQQPQSTKSRAWNRVEIRVGSPLRTCCQELSLSEVEWATIHDDKRRFTNGLFPQPNKEFSQGVPIHFLQVAWSGFDHWCSGVSSINAGHSIQYLFVPNVAESHS